VATLKQVSKEIKIGLKNLGEENRMLRTIAANLHTITLDRIFTKGINSEGNKIGEYRPVSIAIKKEKERFTSSTVNFRDTGKLANSYLFETSRGGYVLGFANISRGDGKTNSELVKKLEEQYGEVFALTDEEDKEIDNIIDDFLDRL
jgi:hypothetical protein